MQSFKEFLLRGNVVDLAVGVIIGSAFSKITSSLVNDIIMPPISLLLSHVSFGNWFIVLKEGSEKGPYSSLSAATHAGATTLNFGNFINVMLNFLIISFCIYILVITINKIKRTLDLQEDKEKKSTTTTCPYCISTINIDAIKCPNCTSKLPKSDKKESMPDDDAKINNMKLKDLKSVIKNSIAKVVDKDFK